MSQVFFIGAGPGDPDLITVKGRDIIARADLIIYAGSLVNPAVLAVARPDARIEDSAGMDLARTTELLVGCVREGKVAARVHTGDPSIYGAIAEQMAELDKAGIGYTVVPGVSSAFAGAAALKCELTLPEVSQTVILTRIGGRTPVPEKESLASLAAHGATMVIFLSVGEMDRVVEALRTGYTDDTPVAVVYKASWPEEKIVRGTIADIASKVESAGLAKTALIFVGRAIAPGVMQAYSKLYDSEFRHGYRG
ncbi:MAG: precorrin-4 C(11)-methyltransferase [Nitrospirae bacterium]|nr:precorrin-4 C(11)-methyltransferase [Nitrospirota bacterium]